MMADVLSSICVVNTIGGDLLARCLDAIDATHPPERDREVLVLDNASDDGSAEIARSRGDSLRLIALDRRTGKAENDSTLLREARGEYCLLLNEDAELLPGAPAALVAALEENPRARAAESQLLVPAARAIHHEQLASDREAAERRIVEFHRNRDLYMRKHHSSAAALAVRVLTAWAYLVRAAGAVVVPGHHTGRYLLHARQALSPGRGEGVREAAERYNRALTGAS